MGDWFAATASTGSMVVAVPIAIAAGVVFFFSPCVLPLLPAYISYATGLSGADLAEGSPRRGQMVLGVALFVLGFSAVFVTLGMVGGSLSTWTGVPRDVLNRVLGALCVLLGLAFMGLVPALRTDLRFHRIPSAGPGSAPIVGVLFGFAWTPCSGPTLGALVGLANASGTAARGGVLLGFYSVGLAIPFLIAALAWRRAMAGLRVVRRHQKWVTRFGGAMFVVIGLALLTGWWDFAVQWLQVELLDAGWSGAAV